MGKLTPAKGVAAAATVTAAARLAPQFLGPVDRRPRDSELLSVRFPPHDPLRARFSRERTCSRFAFRQRNATHRH
jgi:hypothetical protein